MPEHSSDQRHGRLFDGQTARPQRVLLLRRGVSLELVSADGNQALDWHSLRRSADGLTLGDATRPDWRLRLDEPLPADWQVRLAVEGAVTSDDRRRIAMALAGLGAAALMLWLGGTSLLNSVAHRLPRSLTAPIGIGVAQSLGRACTTPAGTAAADALMRRLRDGQSPTEKIKLTIVDAPVVNAMALPGGQVVIFSQLITEARSPDELAGVLAHELSHIRARDSERALVRQFGLSLLLQSLGGNYASGADTLLFLSHSREVEAQADDGAIRLLRAAGIATAPTAAFFDRQQRGAVPAKPPAKAQTTVDVVAERLEKLADFTASHPDNGSRSRLFRAVTLAGKPMPALDGKQWQALRSICAAGRPQLKRARAKTAA